MDRKAAKKLRGAFFTPPGIAAYLVEWAVRSPDDTVFEPSCGEAGFLLAAGRRLRGMGANPLFWAEQLHGVEIHDASARKARDLLRAHGFDAKVDVADFFEHAATRTYDAVVGNPPFVRYQTFSGAARARGLEAALAQGVRLSGLASSWAAFVVKASLHLAPAGRLALVLPAELLSVNYAQEVRTFLLKRFSHLRLILFEERVFPGVLEEVILLLAEGNGGADRFEVHHARDLHSLSSIETTRWTKHVPRDGEKWTPALVACDAFATYRSLVENRFEDLGVWGGAYLGAVTGNNGFFALAAEEARRHCLDDSDLIRISPPGSRHLRGLEFSKAIWQSLADEGLRSLLFYPASEPSRAALQYIAYGDRLGVAKAYKCRTRRPWWRVPLVRIPDLFLTYMNHEGPRVVANSARVQILNSLYGIRLRADRRRIGTALLPIACLNSVTLLGSEIVGRSYGGGLLKLEPREADRLPVPSLRLIGSVEKDLESLRPDVERLLQQGHATAAVRAVDRILLAGISENDLKTVRLARDILFQRRRTRGRRGEN